MHPLWTTITDGTLTDAQTAQLDAYLDRLIEKNKVLNLTRITDRQDAEIKHVADALTLLRHLPPPNPKKPVTLADVGTGGGVPGVILAIARPDLAVTLIDSTKKKLDAVAEMAAAVGVTNVQTFHARIETVKLTYDVITARAVADLATLVEWCRGRLAPDGVLLALKGPKAAEEIESATAVLKRAKLTATPEPVDVPQLAGHAIVVVTRAAKKA